MTIALRQATGDDAATVARLVHSLVAELDPERADAQLLRDYTAVAKSLLDGAHGQARVYWAFLAETPGGEAIGLITLNECAATYAKGRFGEIPELYIAPPWRSQGLGALLLEKAVAFATENSWPRLEVGAPDLPRWQRTVDFYLRQGFLDVGPRLKLAIRQ